ncbi:hypothetical protein OFC55_31320, partial [Escherichia coli]|nr:hypothetical protein [Escherichia coli]
MELEETPESLLKAEPNKDELIKLYGQLTFKSWLNELLEGSSGTVEAVELAGSAQASSSSSHAEMETSAVTIDRSQYETILDEA